MASAASRDDAALSRDEKAHDDKARDEAHQGLGSRVMRDRFKHL